MAVIYKELDNNMVMAYSNAGYKIHGGNPEADYVTATDPKGLNRIYTETDIKVEDVNNDADEATIADYEAAFKEIGVITDEEV